MANISLKKTSYAGKVLPIVLELSDVKNPQKN
jgi:hypothetical protein